jgi:adenine-specific DNA-methyltransferase
MSVEKLDLASPDLVKENIGKLAKLFPNCITESATGKAIDFDLLKQELSYAVVDGSKERYRLEWPGKREAIVTANMPTTKTLRPVREESVDFDKTENIYIEGDNLEVLKILQESYLGKIKVIYIDPPYNTGKDFLYKDNFTKSSQEELVEGGQKDEYHQRLVANPETAGRYHSDWLSMMYPRLKLARNLLKDDGSIFISIDDHEVQNLRKVCDEIFGEENFIASVIWHKVYVPKNSARHFSEDHDYILVYARNADKWLPTLLPRTEAQDAKYKNEDGDPRGPWRPGPLAARNYYSKGTYSITCPGGRVIDGPPSGLYWKYSEEKFRELDADNRIYWGKDGNSSPAPKLYLSEVMQGRVPQTIWKFDEVGHTQEAKQDLLELIKFESSDSVFETPKPSRLIERICHIASNSNTNDIILDFFSGSASTAQGIFKLNAKDKGNRKFILVQLPELTGANDFVTIADLGKERIRRASKKIKEETAADIDYGFRVYRLDSSNMQDVYYRPQDYQQAKLDMFTDNVKPDRTSDDLLAQIMLDWGLPLSLKIEQLIIAGKKVFKVADNSLYACFDKGIDEAFAKELAKDQPLRVVFRDNGFKDDTAKINVKQLLKQLSPETEMKVI